MTSTNVEIVRTIYRAFETGDMAGFSAALAPDIVWNEAENYPYADRNPYVGAQAIMEGVFARTAQDFDGFAVSMTDLIDGGDRVVALGRYTGTSRITGAPLDVQAAHVWRLADGKVVRFQQHIDTLGTARTMGRAG
jgi:ketosteroid isomerase-like protein